MITATAATEQQKQQQQQQQEQQKQQQQKLSTSDREPVETHKNVPLSSGLSVAGMQEEAVGVRVRGRGSEMVKQRISQRLGADLRVGFTHTAA
ncbi:GL24904 [Drosophila persimilis]|uniref:GL24904 n=1 Tax=Drosophila persimilis TaxID=7234 RepID=B4GRN1_DROPE|nr:GL24904 [Drosophila persimilis]